MNRLTRWMLVLAMMTVVAAPAYSSDVMQFWHCEMEEGTTEEEVEELAQAMLEAVRKMDGGKDADVMVFFPVAVTNMGNTDFILVLSAPSFTDWGKFWDGYSDDSPMAKVDEMNDGKVICPESAIWEGVRMEAK
ncbi:MAG: hypothetical protein GY719_40540 [bacterium]|nr:hypothetical protein [bacterium]